MGEALDVFHKLVAALKAGDDDATRALIDPDFVMHEDPSMPYGGIYRGPDGMLTLAKTVWSVWGGAHFELLHQLEEAGGQRMCTVNRFRGTPGKSKTEIEALINEIWTVRDGRMIEGRVWYYDATRIAKAITDG